MCGYIIVGFCRILSHPSACSMWPSSPSTEHSISEPSLHSLACVCTYVCAQMHACTQKLLQIIIILSQKGHVLCICMLCILHTVKARALLLIRIEDVRCKQLTRQGKSTAALSEWDKLGPYLTRFTFESAAIPGLRTWSRGVMWYSKNVAGFFFSTWEKKDLARPRLL